MNRATKSYLILALCVLTFLQMPIATDPPCAQLVADNFIRTSGPHLCLNGQALKLLGANSYGILGGYLGIGYINSQTPESPVRLNDAANAGLRVIRFWLDVTNSDYWFPLAYSKFSDDHDHKPYFAALDRLVADAKANDVYLVPVLASAFDQWTALGNGESFWKIGTKTNLRFKEWVSAIVRKYSGDSQIAWWEIANEPNHFGMSGQNSVDLNTLAVWAGNMYSFVKSLDTVHIVCGGFNNTGNLDIAAFDKLNRPFDIASIHIYEDDLYKLEAGKGILDKERAIEDFIKIYSSHSKNVLRKPLVFGEFNGDNKSTGKWFVETFLKHALEKADAALIWLWEEGTPGATYYVAPKSTPEIVETLCAYSASLRR